jgi:N-acetylglucosaminyldiphosphoundecaprenol N-acetyl-beta-D-mannosaminyltransferase
MSSRQAPKVGASGRMEKYDVLGIGVTGGDYAECVRSVICAAQERTAFAVTALAVHGLVAASLDKTQAYRLRQFALVTPDGQPVRWALRILHGIKLPDRVYGPTLMLRICEAASEVGIAVYLYGSSETVVTQLAVSLKRRLPSLMIAGSEPSRFRRTTSEEKAALITRIAQSGARILFVGLGCPRQEVFAFEYHQQLRMPVLAVGAAFDYHSGSLREPPAWVQRFGLQWLCRLIQEPRRLFWRYFITNSAFILLLALQALRLWRPKPNGELPPDAEELYG